MVQVPTLQRQHQIFQTLNFSFFYISVQPLIQYPINSGSNLDILLRVPPLSSTEIFISPTSNIRKNPQCREWSTRVCDKIEMWRRRCKIKFLGIYIFCCPCGLWLKNGRYNFVKVSFFVQCSGLRGERTSLAQALHISRYCSY